MNIYCRCLTGKGFGILVRNVSSAAHTQRFPKRVFSGIQPSGTLHLGNYFGAIQPWIKLQEDADCFYSIVDLHSITLPQDPEILRNSIYKLAATLLACGLDPRKCTLFQQSDVLEHTELSWILGCFITMPRLAHLPQYKEKSSTLKDVPLGIYIYPVLQCADILAYRSTDVPVGEDQTQHIQLAQHLALKFNKRFKETFPVPNPIIVDSFCKRVLNFREPSKKMSKSDPNEKSRIELTDTPDMIRNKFKKAITDFTPNVTYDPVARPGVSNLVSIHSQVSGLTPHAICNKYSDLQTAQYKMVVADATVEALKPIQLRLNELLGEPEYIKGVLRTGAEKAREVASETLREVKSAVGLTISR